MEAVDRPDIAARRIGDAQLPGAGNGFAIERGKQLFRHITAGERRGAAANRRARGIVEHSEGSGAIGGPAAEVVAGTAPSGGKADDSAIGMNEFEVEIRIISVIEPHPNVHISNRADIREGERNFHRRVVGNGHGYAAAAVVRRRRTSRRAQSERITDRAQIGRAILELKDCGANPAAGTVGGKRKGAAHRRPTSQKRPKGLRGTGSRHPVGDQQGGDQIGGAADADVFQTKVNGDDFPGINRPVAGGATFRRQRVGVETDHGSFCANAKGHRGPAGAEVMKDKAGRRPVPPARAGSVGIAKPIRVAGGGVAEEVEVFGIAGVEIFLKVPQVVGLDQGDLVVRVDGIEVGVLVVFVPQLINMPDRDPGSRQVGVAPGLLAVLHEIVFGGRSRLGVPVELVEAGIRRAHGSREIGTAGQTHGGRPTGGSFEVGANLHRVAAGTAITHQAKNPGSAVRIVAIIVDVREAAEHVSIFVTEGAQRQRGADVRDLVFIDLFPVAKIQPAGQHPRVRPQAKRPDPAVVPGEENVTGQHLAAGIHRKVAESRQDGRGVIRQSLHGIDRGGDERPPFRSAINRGVVVVRLGQRHPDVERDHVAVGELVVRIVEVVFLHRAVVPVAGVTVAIGKIEDFRLRDGSHIITEIYQQGQPELHSGGGERGRRQLWAVLRGQVSQLPFRLQLAPPLTDAHHLIPVRKPLRHLLPNGLGIDPQMLLQTQGHWIALPHGDPGGEELIAGGGQLRVFIGLGRLVEHHGVTVQRLKDRIKFIALAPQHNRRAVRLRERNLVGERRCPSRQRAQNQQRKDAAWHEAREPSFDPNRRIVCSVPTVAPGPGVGLKNTHRRPPGAFAKTKSPEYMMFFPQLVKTRPRLPPAGSIDNRILRHGGMEAIGRPSGRLPDTVARRFMEETPARFQQK